MLPKPIQRFLPLPLADSPRRYRRKPPPICPVHGVPMIVGSSPRDLRYFYCPVHGCSASAQQIKY
jgi:hypothetical protein